MEKKREQELSVLEVLRLHREFHLPAPFRQTNRKSRWIR